MRNHFIFFTIFFAVLSAFFPFSAQAFTGSGSGTTSSPYIITSCSQLQEMNNSVSSNYKLGNSIDCASFGNFTPVSTFTGSFDGDGRTIYNLYISRTTQYAALFGITNGTVTIKNVTLHNVMVSSTSYFVAGLIGFNGGNLTVSRVGVVSSTIKTTYSSAAYMGAILGAWYGSNVTTTLLNTFAYNTIVTGTAASRVGGLIGDVDALGSMGTVVSSSYFAGTIVSNGNVGGLVGFNYNGGTANRLYINDSFAVATITPSGASAGGLVGYLYSGSYVYLSNAWYDAKGYSTSTFKCTYGYSIAGCTGVNTGGTSTAYFKNSSSTAPMSSWNFTDTWQVTSEYPTLIPTTTASVIFSVTGVSTTEGGVPASFNVMLGSSPTNTVDVVFTTTSSRVEISTTSVRFTSSTWNSPVTVQVTAVDNTGIEGITTSSIIANIVSAMGDYSALASTTIGVTTTDNDSSGVTISTTTLSVAEGGSQGSFTVVLNSAPSTTVNITISTSSSRVVISSTTLSFTASDWNSAQTVYVTSVNNSVADGTVTSSITFSASSGDSAYNSISISRITVTSTDNDTAGVTVSSTSISVTEGSTTSSFTVVLNSQPTSTVNITLTTSSARVLLSTTTLSFSSASWDTAQTVIVTAFDNNITDGTVTSSITFAASSSASQYNNISISRVVVTSTDNDTPGVTISSSVVSVTEGSITSSFTVVLNSQPTSTVNITLTTSSARVLLSTTTLSFSSASWNVLQTVVVTAVDNTAVEGTTTSSVNFAISGGGNYAGISVSPVVVTTTDNDIPNVTVSNTSLSVSEGGSAASFSVVLDTPPTSSVSVFISSGSGRVSLSTSSILFTTSSWNSSITVSVSAVDNAIVDGSASVALTLSVSSSDSNYNGISISSVNVSVSDNDVAVDIAPSFSSSLQGSFVFSAPSEGAGSSDVAIPTGQSRDIGAIGTGGVNTLVYIYSTANFMAYESRKDSVAPHQFFVKDIDLGKNYITLEFHSEKKLVKLKKGSTKKIDLDGDGVMDITATFVGTNIARAEVTIKDLQPKQKNKPSLPLLKYDLLSESVSSTPILMFGSFGKEVYELQKKLNKNGFFISSFGPGSVGQETYYFGEKTRLAVEAFQKSRGIEPALGYVGPRTKEALESL